MALHILALLIGTVSVATAQVCSNDAQQVRACLIRPCNGDGAECYDRMTPPLGFDSQTPVYVQAWPLRLDYVDEQLHSVDMPIALAMLWQDPRLARFNGSDFVEFHADDLWWPRQLDFDERMSRGEANRSPIRPTTPIRVDRSGWASMNASYRSLSICPMHKRTYPVMNINCTLTMRTNSPTIRIGAVPLCNSVPLVEMAAICPASDAVLFDSGTWLANGRLTIVANVDGQWRYQLRRKYYADFILWFVMPFAMVIPTILALYLACELSEKYSFGSSITIALVLMMIAFSNHTVPLRSGVHDQSGLTASLLYVALISSVVLATLLSTVPDRIRRSYERARASPHDKGVGRVKATLYWLLFASRAVDVVLAIVQLYYVFFVCEAVVGTLLRQLIGSGEIDLDDFVFEPPEVAVPIP